VEKSDAAAAEFQEMIGGEKSGAAIVDANKVVGTARGIFVEIAVEKDNSDFCALERCEEMLVDLRGMSVDFDGSQKDSGNFTIDVLGADGFDFAFGAFGGIGGGPKNGMTAGLS
jgi:hypothetical protein